MTLIERIIEEASALQPEMQQYVLDFVISIKSKEQQYLEADMDAIIAENLPVWKELAK